jgi:hypothetical protein
VAVKGMSRMSSTAPFLVLGEMDTHAYIRSSTHTHTRLHAEHYGARYDLRRLCGCARSHPS